MESLEILLKDYIGTTATIKNTDHTIIQIFDSCTAKEILAILRKNNYKILKKESSYARTDDKIKEYTTIHFRKIYN